MEAAAGAGVAEEALVGDAAEVPGARARMERRETPQAAGDRELCQCVSLGLQGLARAAVGAGDRHYDRRGGLDIGAAGR